MTRDCLTAEREYELALLAAAGNRNAKAQEECGKVIVVDGFRRTHDSVYNTFE